MDKRMKFTRPDARAVAIALDELIGYVETVGEEDERREVLRWAVRRLTDLLARYDYSVAA